MASKISRKRKRRRNQLKTFAATGVLVLVCTGCLTAYWYLSQAEERQPLLLAYAYEAEEEYSINLVSEEHEQKLFAEDLCVVTGESQPDEAIAAGAAVIFNTTDHQVVYSHNAFERLYPASVTKLTTCLVALKYGNLTDRITVTDQMLANLDPASSVCGVSVGDTLTLEQLLYGLMLPSGNDAANVIAYALGGNEAGFAAMMNDEAACLGATGTHYVNAHGLNDTAHYTTAYDIYLIFNELMNYDKFREIISTQDYVARYTNSAGGNVEKTWHRGIWYFNDAAFAPDGVTAVGGKTGTTPEAKYCLALESQDRDGKQYVSVVLKAESRELLYQNMTALLSKIYQ